MSPSLRGHLAFYYRCGGDGFLAPLQGEPAFEAVFNPQKITAAAVSVFSIHPLPGRSELLLGKMCCLCSNASFLVLYFLRLENTGEGKNEAF